MKRPLFLLIVIITIITSSCTSESIKEKSSKANESSVPNNQHSDISSSQKNKQNNVNKTSMSEVPKPTIDSNDNLFKSYSITLNYPKNWQLDSDDASKLDDVNSKTSQEIYKFNNSDGNRLLSLKIEPDSAKGDIDTAILGTKLFFSRAKVNENFYKPIGKETINNVEYFKYSTGDYSKDLSSYDYVYYALKNNRKYSFSFKISKTSENDTISKIMSTVNINDSKYISH